MTTVIENNKFKLVNTGTAYKLTAKPLTAAAKYAVEFDKEYSTIPELVMALAEHIFELVDSKAPKATVTVIGPGPSGVIGKNATNEKLSDDGSVRKTYYGDGEQPWDVAKRLGWAPAFAAANVLKYIRRQKDDPADDLKKAQWYYKELLAMASRRNDWQAMAINAFSDLRAELTGSELSKLEGKL